ncbi:MAG: transcriptional regulator [Acidobacteria bacterium]|jgi:hypothetical protein|nr:transcriptional regulator [Acidobacteriota bacterium]MDP7338555.1 DUF4188 domain-containing protein [Vicinamibacterales bacterium]MDP7479930.1 DUF4188 domain-containing protein [Vicinamibacterales bacterium]HJN44383.1 DUF4188 domain-containing protein [Vicinamibacterales bacterium]|tara:strand:- start:273 stop:749 length:477 start_codon:yes stop_codon:yes gene_type:complete
MGNAIAQRMTVQVEGDFVVFLIGLRIGTVWKIHRWLPVFLAMRRMARELAADPEIGLLGQVAGTRVTVQYWRSFDHLEAYARSKAHAHWPAWVDFNQTNDGSRADVGIWHETYKVRAGEYEAFYRGVPPFGLGRVGQLMPVTGRRESARGRIEGSSGV